MKPSEAAEILKGIEEFEGNLPEDGLLVEEAWGMAISALDKQEQDRWRPFRCRKTTEDDCSSFDYIMDCELPEDGQEILITVNNSGHEPVQIDTFFGGGGEECALDSGYNLCDEAVAWRPLPEPYKAEEES